MALVPYLSCLVGFAVFLVAVVARAIRWARFPMHLRWELYPVPHEPPEKARYGGSFMEDSDWWKRPRQTSKMGGVKAMLPEILFLSAVREHSRALWYRSFPFHFGMYLAASAIAVAGLGGLASSIAPQLSADGLGEALRIVVMGLGVAGFGLATLGALGLLVRRLTDPALRRFATPADLMNLVLFVVAFGTSLLCFVLVDSDARRAVEFARNLVMFEWSPISGQGLEVALPTLVTVMLSALVAYVPLTHMSHFVGKYFAYHAIRWNDVPNLAGGSQEAKIRRMLEHKVSWSAAHIRGGGEKSWSDVAVEAPIGSKSS